MKHLDSNRKALTLHVKSINHSFYLGRARILSFEPFYRKRIIREMIQMIHIEADKNSINHRIDIANLCLI